MVHINSTVPSFLHSCNLIYLFYNLNLKSVTKHYISHDSLYLKGESDRQIPWYKWHFRRGSSKLPVAGCFHSWAQWQLCSGHESGCQMKPRWSRDSEHLAEGWQVLEWPSVSPPRHAVQPEPLTAVNTITPRIIQWASVTTCIWHLPGSNLSQGGCAIAREVTHQLASMVTWFWLKVRQDRYNLWWIKCHWGKFSSLIIPSSKLYSLDINSIIK